MKENNEYQKGLFYITSVYFIWGILPAYWKLMQDVHPMIILSHRVLWSFIFLSIIVSTFYRSGNIFTPVKEKKNIVLFLLASIAVSIQWGAYLLAIITNHVIELSMGYYIYPIVVVVFSKIFFKEKMNMSKTISLLLAFTGVMIMIIQYKKVPVLALTLAFSFAFYSVIKKKLKVNAITSIFFEILFMMPIALVYAVYIEISGKGYFIHPDIEMILLLMGGGIVTSVTLLLFASGAKRIHFATVGFLQYISPTIVLFLGIFVYKENFDLSNMISFGFIWIALIIYSLPTVLEDRTMKYKKGAT